MSSESETKIAFIFDVMEREPFLEQLLLQIIKRFRLTYYVFFDDGNSSIVLNVQGKQKEISDFSDTFSLEFPTSLQFRFKRVVVLPEDTIIQSYASTLPSFSSTIQEQRLLPQKTLEILQNIDSLKAFPYQGKLFLEKRAILSEGQEAQYSVVAESFRALAYKMTQREEVCIQTLYGLKIFTLDASKRECIIPSDLAALKSYFHVNTAQMEALNSWEKPILFLSLLEESHNQKQTYFSLHTSTMIVFNEAVLMPFDYVVYLLVHALKQFGVEMCYMYSCPIHNQEELLETFKNVFLSERLIVIEPMKVAIAQNSQWVDLSKERSVLDCSHYLNAFFKEAELEEAECFSLHLSYDLPTLGTIIRQGEIQRILNITFSLSLESYFDDLAYDNRVREFIARFTHVQDFLALRKKESDSSAIISHNLFDFLGVVYQILYDHNLEFNMAKIHMLQQAQYCMQPSLPIDFHFYLKNQEVIFDSLETLCTYMQLRMSGVAENVLALSLVEGMARFYGQFLQMLKEQWGEHPVLLSGSMLSYTPFLDPLLGHLPQSLSCILPRTLPLDCVKSTSKWYNLC